MRKAFDRLNEVVRGNRRQHAARYAPVERFGEFEADRAEACHRHAQRGFRYSHFASHAPLAQLVRLKRSIELVWPRLMRTASGKA